MACRIKRRSALLRNSEWLGGNEKKIHMRDCLCSERVSGQTSSQDSSWADSGPDTSKSDKDTKVILLCERGNERLLFWMLWKKGHYYSSSSYDIRTCTSIMCIYSPAASLSSTCPVLESLPPNNWRDKTQAGLWCEPHHDRDLRSVTMFREASSNFQLPENPTLFFVRVFREGNMSVISKPTFS